MGGQSIVLEFWVSRHSCLNAIYSVSFLLLLLFTSVAFGLPVKYGHAHRRGSEIQDLSRIQDLSQLASGSSAVGGYEYLMKYGYMPISDMETGALRTDEELSQAVRKFQKMANIAETGKLDPQTLQAMKKPRCGVPDMTPDSENRRQRGDDVNKPSDFKLLGSKWQKTQLTWRTLLNAVKRPTKVMKRWMKIIGKKKCFVVTSEMKVSSTGFNISGRLFRAQGPLAEYHDDTSCIGCKEIIVNFEQKCPHNSSVHV